MDFLLLGSASVSPTDPADVLALRAGGEGLGADNGVSPHEGVLLVDVRAALLWSDHRAVVGRQQAVHARLLVDLHKEYVVMKNDFIKQKERHETNKICQNKIQHKMNQFQHSRIRWQKTTVQ